MTWTGASNRLRERADGELDVLGRTIAHYRVLEKIGQGAMSEVYRAEDLELGRVVALKFLPAALLSKDDARSRLRQEARAAASLDQPYVPAVYEVCQSHDFAFLALALIEGETLQARIARDALPISDALRTGEQIADGLQHVHSRGIVHRDVKPSNIMLRPDGGVTLLDFGISASHETLRTLQAEEIVGTAAYMSPEQATSAHVDQRTDLWSLGCVLYEMLAGRPPFDLRFEAAILYAIVSEEPAPLSTIRPDVPPELESVVQKCLSKDLSQRYQSAAEVAADIKQLRTQWESTVAPRAEPPSTERQPSHRWWNPEAFGSRFPTFGVFAAAASFVSKLSWSHRSSAAAAG